MAVGAEDRTSTLRSGLWLPLFEELAEPALVAALAVAAENAGWHKVFDDPHGCARQADVGEVERLRRHSQRLCRA